MTFSSEHTGGLGKALSGNGGLPAAMNVGNIERTASLLAGAVGLLLLSRRLFVYVSLALLSAYLVYRGVTGRCALYARANLNTRGMDDLADATGAVKTGADNLRNAAASIADHIGAEESFGESEAAEIEKWIEAERAQDLVEQSSWESFPASDPPGGSVA